MVSPKYTSYEPEKVVQLRDSYGGGPPKDGDMEARVSKLENDLKDIKGDLKTLVKDVAEMKGRVSAMPTAFQLLGMVVAIMGATFAFIRFGLAGLH